MVYSLYISTSKELLASLVFPHQRLRSPSRVNVRNKERKKEKKMRCSISTFAVSVLALLAPLGVKANTPLSDAFVQNDVGVNKGYEIAWASRP